MTPTKQTKLSDDYLDDIMGEFFAHIKEGFKWSHKEEAWHLQVDTKQKVKKTRKKKLN